VTILAWLLMAHFAAQAAEQLGHRRRRNEIAVRFVPARGLPIKPHRARNVAFAIGLVVTDVADFDDAKIGVGEMFLEPGGGDEGRRNHRTFSLPRRGRDSR